MSSSVLVRAASVLRSCNTQAQFDVGIKYMRLAERSVDITMLDFGDSLSLDSLSLYHDVAKTVKQIAKEKGFKSRYE